MTPGAERKPAVTDSLTLRRNTSTSTRKYRDSINTCIAEIHLIASKPSREPRKPWAVTTVYSASIILMYERSSTIAASTSTLTRRRSNVLQVSVQAG